MHITIISPYHGGSHKAWAEGYRRYSDHEVELLTLPARFWKWRMHGAAVTLARRLRESDRRTDLLLVTDMLDLSTFLALTRRDSWAVPTVLYMHENQLTYPLPAQGDRGPMRRQHGERDLHYVFINFASMLAADAVFFNSLYHLESLFDALPNFLKHFPDYNELQRLTSLREKSRVLPVGLDLQTLEAQREAAGDQSADRPPLILWNQRWEYDKNPAAFFQALYILAEEGIPFRLALCGQRFRQRPAEFEEAQRRLDRQIVHVGHAKPYRYRQLLWQANVTVSTAHHEFFGVSILEATYCHTFPILPRRLSYPELLPEAFHDVCLYESQEGLVQRLRWALTHAEEARQIAGELAPAVSRFGWHNLRARYDESLQHVAQGLRSVQEATS
ncbi:MAG: tRNA-queuosine alpha-mannosyltransferase domain-containing protein [Chloroflexota bacterium]